MRSEFNSQVMKSFSTTRLVTPPHPNQNVPDCIGSGHVEYGILPSCAAPPLMDPLRVGLHDDSLAAFRKPPAVPHRLRNSSSRSGRSSSSSAGLFPRTSATASGSNAATAHQTRGTCHRDMCHPGVIDPQLRSVILPCECPDTCHRTYRRTCHRTCL